MGWAEGLQSGLALGNAFRQGQIRNDLSEEAKKHQVTEFNPDQAKLDALIAQRDAELQGLGATATPEQLQQVHSQYTPQIAEISQGIKPQYSYGGQTFTDRKAADLAAEQGLTAGMANVYALHGDIEKASELKSRGLQQKLVGYQVDQAQRADELAKTKASIDKEFGEWNTKRLTDPETGEMRAPTFDDNLAGSQFLASKYIKAGQPELAAQHQKDFLHTASLQIQVQDAQRKQAVDLAVPRVIAGDLEAAKDFYHKFVPDGANVKDMVKNSDGSITIKRETLDGIKLPDTKLGSLKQLAEGLVGMTDGNKVLQFAQQEFENGIKTQTLGLHKTQAATQQTLAEAQLKRLSQPQIGAIKTFKDEKTGNAVLVDTSALKSENGVLQLPKGLVPVNAKTAPSDAAVATLAKSILADNKSNYNMVDGKKVKISEKEAGDRARRILERQAPNANEDLSPEDRLILLMQQSQAQ